MLGLAGVGWVGACAGDTLYEANAVRPPNVQIVNPLSGQEFDVGEPIDLRVFAEDTLGVREIVVTLTFATETGVVADTVWLDFDPAVQEVDETTEITAPAEPGDLELLATATNALNAASQSGLVGVRVREIEEP